MTWCQQTSKVPIIFLFIIFSLTVKTAAFSPVTAASEIYAASSSAQQQAEYAQPAEKQDTVHDEADELFKDVDPRTLAAVLLEALNQPEKQKMSEREEEGEEVEKEKDLQGADRDRDGHKELELVMAAAAAQGKEEKEREEEEQRKRAEEEERLTEKVTSRTTSQTVQIKEQVAPQEGVTKKKGVIMEEEREEPELGEEEEQLSSEEVKNLETVLEELQSYSTATKRERDTPTGQRESRAEYFDYLDRNGLMNSEVKPKVKGNDIALSKKKLKWQLEQEKNKIQPLQRGGNFMDDFTNNLAEPEEEDEEEQEDEEQLSPEEEESRAKAEQEEVRRQAAEAQRAKAEEEKLADIASDMLLKYIGKQDKKKYQDNNGAEDKRSEEEDTTDNDDDDIDPQTIDKLIEISSKLHLPADDVVDIINDVEKKKKKDAPETLQWQRPLMSPPAPIAPSTTLLRKPPTAKPPQPNTSPLKAWFKDKASVRPSKQDMWSRQQWPFRSYPSYNFYQKPYQGYYPIYIPPPKPKSRYYSKPSFSFNDVLGNSLDYDLDYSPRRKSRPWAQPRQRIQPAFQRTLYFPHPQTFKAIPMPKPRSPPRRWPSFYYPARAPVVTREEDYYSSLRKMPQESEEELENFIERVFMKHPRMFQ